MIKKTHKQRQSIISEINKNEDLLRKVIFAMNEISVGSIVQVKNELVDEGTGIDLNGWKAFVRQIFDPDENQPFQIVLIEWTAETILQIPDQYFQKVLNNEESWSTYALPSSCVTVIQESHSAIDLEWAKETVSNRIFWPLLGRDGKTIQQVFDQQELNREQYPAEYWIQYLNQNIKYPVKCKVDYEYEDEDGILKLGDIVMLQKLSGWDVNLGLWCEVTFQNRNYILPLQDITGFGGPISKNNRLIEAYYTWIAYRS